MKDFFAVTHIKQPDAAIRWVLAALDQTLFCEFVENADEGNRLDFQQVRQAGLMDAFIVGEIGERLPLRPCQAKTFGALLEPLAKQSRDVMQKETEGRAGIHRAAPEKTYACL
jgi:hypothetical protein